MKKKISLALCLCTLGTMALMSFGGCNKKSDDVPTVENSHRLIQPQSDAKEAICDHCGIVLHGMYGVTYKLSENQKYYILENYPHEYGMIIPSYYKARGDEEYLPVLEARIFLRLVETLELSPVIEEVTFIDENACKEIIVPESNKFYKSVDGVLFNKEGTKLIKYPALKEEATYTFPEGVTEIADHAFGNTKNLTSLILPEGLLKIDGFNVCPSLKKLVIPASLKEIGYGAFDGWKEDQTIYMRAEAEPEGWRYWDSGCYAKIVWGYKGD